MINLPKNSLIHFIAIGGIGMSGLAKILLEAGYRVSGSDLNENNLTEYLKNKGATIYKGHSPDNVKDCSLVIRSTAIKDSNPEITAALSSQIPIMHRAELLNEIMSNQNISIGITGTHGKTTTTGMIATIFHEMGQMPGFAIGGEIPQLKTNASLGGGMTFIAEMDESDGTVELYKPNISVITNLEYEHPDHYKDGFEQLLDTFISYVEKLNISSKIIINLDDDGNSKLIQKFLSKKPSDLDINCSIYHINRFITYSLNSNQTDYYAFVKQTPQNTVMDIFQKGTPLGQVTLNVPGKHNASNALGAIIAAMEAGHDFTWISLAISKFTGMKKRFQTLGHANGAQIVDDYAHHPTEIKATIKTAKSLEKGRVIAIFQPHRYTRLARLWDDFLSCFKEADIVYVCDVYSAEEDQIEDFNSEKFHNHLQHPCAYYIKGELDNVADAVIKDLQVNDIVLTMGAGTITKLGPIILEKVNGKS